MDKRYYVMPIEGAEPELDGPYPDFDTMLIEAKKHWAEMDTECDSISYLYIDAKGEPSVNYFTNDQMDSESPKLPQVSYSPIALCSKCRVEFHDTCSMTEGCPCCDDTIRQLAEERQG